MDSPLSSALSLSLPVEPVSPHQLRLSSCLSHRFKISLSLPPLTLLALPSSSSSSSGPCHSLPADLSLYGVSHSSLALAAASLRLCPCCLLISLYCLFFCEPDSYFHPHPTPPTALSHLQTFPSPRPRSGVAVPLSTSPALLLHVGELTGAAGTTGRL